MKKIYFIFISCMALISLEASPSYFYSPFDYQKYLESAKVDPSKRAENLSHYLEAKVPGLEATYQDVIQALIENGHQVYLRGGVLRDLLSASPSEPNDVDLDYIGNVNDLIQILDKRRWRYSHFPEKHLVVIGDPKHGSIDAMAFEKSEDIENGSSEFTINNILYHCNKQEFINSSLVGLEDLQLDRIHIATLDWHAWFYEKTHPYNKIFRFWKMVGQGYIYSAELQEFFIKETLDVIKDDPQGFNENLVYYFGQHLNSFDQVYHGSVGVMGYSWAYENVFKMKQRFNEKWVEFEARTAFYTKNKSSL